MSVRPHIAALLAGTLAACGGSHAPADAGPDASVEEDGGADVNEFLPVQSDFDGYSTWMSYDGGTNPPDALVVVAQRTLYLNMAPQPDSTSFPPGTIIVKTTVGAQTFAMAKVGGTFNDADGGATGWEWFELSGPPSDVTIVWRGPSPPPGVVYSGQLEHCNGCHAQAAGNDFVAGTSLQLSSF